MSVTFGIEALPTGEWAARCDESGAVFRGGSEDAVTAQAAAHAAACPACRYWGLTPEPLVDVDSGLDINLSNTNAAMILDRLGFDAELTGCAPGEDFLGRVLLAEATLSEVDAEAVPDVELPRVPGSSARFILGGTRAGYLPRRIAELRTIAEEAARLGRDVTWG